MMVEKKDVDGLDEIFKKAVAIAIAMLIYERLIKKFVEDVDDGKK